MVIIISREYEQRLIKKIINIWSIWASMTKQERLECKWRNKSN